MKACRSWYRSSHAEPSRGGKGEVQKLARIKELASTTTLATSVTNCFIMKAIRTSKEESHNSDGGVGGGGRLCATLLLIFVPK